MGNWIIRWNFDKESYAPGESPLISFWLENTYDTYLYVSELGLEFNFGLYNLNAIGGMIPPRMNMFLGNISILLPENAVGIKTFRLKYRMAEYINNELVDLGFFNSDDKYFISIYPKPFYRVFVSRGLRIEDKMIGDPIAEMIREWGFETVTVGIERQVPDEQVPIAIKNEIMTADAIIAIATPRYMDAITGLWRTLEWAHGEIGIAFGVDKPLLILKDSAVSLGGLPSYLETQTQTLPIEYSPYNLEELRINMSLTMPAFRNWIESKKRQDREWIENRRRQEYFDGLKTIAVGGLAVVGGIALLNGIIGALSDTSEK